MTILGIYKQFLARIEFIFYFREKSAAVKIQAHIRSYIARKKFHLFLRKKFDEIDKKIGKNANDLTSQLIYLLFFFQPMVDCSRAVCFLSSCFLAIFKNIFCFSLFEFEKSV